MGQCSQCPCLPSTSVFTHCNPLLNVFIFVLYFPGNLQEIHRILPGLQSCSPGPCPIAEYLQVNTLQENERINFIPEHPGLRHCPSGVPCECMPSLLHTNYTAVRRVLSDSVSSRPMLFLSNSIMSCPILSYLAYCVLQAWSILGVSKKSKGVPNSAMDEDGFGQLFDLLQNSFCVSLQRRMRRKPSVSKGLERIKGTMQTLSMSFM